jgi:hypothetical protein
MLLDFRSMGTPVDSTRPLVSPQDLTAFAPFPEEGAPLFRVLCQRVGFSQREVRLTSR